MIVFSLLRLVFLFVLYFCFTSLYIVCTTLLVLAVCPPPSTLSSTRTAFAAPPRTPILSTTLRYIHCLCSSFLFSSMLCIFMVIYLLFILSLRRELCVSLWHNILLTSSLFCSAHRSSSTVTTPAPRWTEPRKFLPLVCPWPSTLPTTRSPPSGITGTCYFSSFCVFSPCFFFSPRMCWRALTVMQIKPPCLDFDLIVTYFFFFFFSKKILLGMFRMRLLLPPRWFPLLLLLSLLSIT